jgi:hypothetical protein
MQAAKAIIRRPAPAFTGQAWWNQKFQQISLEDFKGKLLVPFQLKHQAFFTHLSELQFSHAPHVSHRQLI